MIDIPLPGMPEPPPRRESRPQTGERFSRYRTPRRLCDQCIFLIHRYGVGNAEPPRSARWRRTGPTGTNYVCESHKETRL